MTWLWLFSGWEEHAELLGLAYTYMHGRSASLSGIADWGESQLLCGQDTHAAPWRSGLERMDGAAANSWPAGTVSRHEGRSSRPECAFRGAMTASPERA